MSTSKKDLDPADYVDPEIKRRMREDPEYRAAVEAADAERVAIVAERSDDVVPIVRDLRGAGLDVDSVWDLINGSDSYVEALPVLLEHLERGGYLDDVMESLGRALAVKRSVEWWDRLEAVYRTAGIDSGQEHGAAIALAACATRGQVDRLVGLLGVQKPTASGVYFLRPIMRLGGEDGFRLIESLRDDPLLGREATALTRRRRTKNES